MNCFQELERTRYARYSYVLLRQGLELQHAYVGRNRLVVARKNKVDARLDRCCCCCTLTSSHPRRRRRMRKSTLGSRASLIERRLHCLMMRLGLGTNRRMMTERCVRTSSMRKFFLELFPRPLLRRRLYARLFPPFVRPAVGRSLVCMLGIAH